MLFQPSTYRNAGFRRKKGHSEENLVGIAGQVRSDDGERCSHADDGRGTGVLVIPLDLWVGQPPW